MKTIIFTTIEKKIIKEWQSLWDNSDFANYVNGPQWFISVIETFKYKNFIIMALYENGKLVAVAALIKEKKYGINFYTIPPGDFVCGIPFLIDLQNKKVVKALFKNLSKMGNIFIDNVPEAFATGLIKNIPNINIAPYSTNYYMTFEKDNNGEVMFKNRKKLMSEVRNIEDKFTLESYNGYLPESLKVAFNIDIRSRKLSRGYNAFSDKSIKNFYISLAKYFKNNFLVNILYFNNKPIAYAIGFTAGNHYFASQTAFVEKYGRYSPGKVLYVKLIDTLSAKNIKILDFGSGENFFKRSFTKDSRLLYKITISENFLIRVYIKQAYRWKRTIFNRMKEHIRFYASYRNIRSFLGI